MGRGGGGGKIPSYPMFGALAELCTQRVNNLAGALRQRGFGRARAETKTRTQKDEDLATRDTFSRRQGGFSRRWGKEKKRRETEEEEKQNTHSLRRQKKTTAPNADKDERALSALCVHVILVLPGGPSCGET